MLVKPVCCSLTKIIFKLIFWVWISENGNGMQGIGMPCTWMSIVCTVQYRTANIFVRTVRQFNKEFQFPPYDVRVNMPLPVLSLYQLFLYPLFPPPPPPPHPPAFFLFLYLSFFLSFLHFLLHSSFVKQIPSLNHSSPLCSHSREFDLISFHFIYLT